MKEESHTTISYLMLLRVRELLLLDHLNCCVHLSPRVCVQADALYAFLSECISADTPQHPILSSLFKSSTLSLASSHFSYSSTKSSLLLFLSISIHPTTLSLTSCICSRHNSFLHYIEPLRAEATEMWMRGYTNPASNNVQDNSNTISSQADSFYGRRLRPLIPKPSTSTAAAAPSPSLHSCINHGNCDTTNFFTLNHHMVASQHNLMGGGEHHQFNGHYHQSVVVSSRWNPTPDQLRALEELYRRGTRTPSADQIQHITSQLRRYGKIEGKNVFYWFQNHKARERQKRRRQQLENNNSSSSNDQQHLQDHHQLPNQPAGDGGNHNDNKQGSTAGFEIEQTKHWAAPTNCSTLADQESVHKPEKAAADDGLGHFQGHHNSLQNSSTIGLQESNEIIADEHRRRRTSLKLTAKKNAMWGNTQISFPKPIIMHQTSTINEVDEHEDGRCNSKERALTLELFPLESNVAMDLTKEGDNNDGENDEKGNNLTSYQFFEFFPVKNSTAY